MPPPQQPGNLKAHLAGAGVHIAGDVTLHIGTIGTLNLYMSPSPDSPIAATAAAPNTSPLHPPASAQVRNNDDSIFNINSFHELAARMHLS